MPIPSPSTVPSASFEKGLISPVGESAIVLEKHMCMKISLSVSTPPVMTMSLRSDKSSNIARCIALNELAHAASTTQFVPPRLRRFDILPATTLPKRPGKEFSCHDTYESDIFCIISSVFSEFIPESSRAFLHCGWPSLDPRGMTSS